MDGLQDTRSALDWAKSKVSKPLNTSIEHAQCSFPMRRGRHTGLQSLIRAVQTHSSRNPDQTRPRHPQVRQRGQRDNLRRVLGQAPVAHLVEAELLLDHLERVRDLEVRLDERIEQSALARAHRYMAKSGLSLQRAHAAGHQPH